MRKMKKFLCAALTTTMVLAMAAPSFAEGNLPTGNASITIESAKEGDSTASRTYTIYQIFSLESFEVTKTDETENGREDWNYAYKVNPEWKSFIKGYTVKEGEATVSAFELDSKDEYLLSTKITANSDQAAEFAKAALVFAKENSTTITGIERASENGSLTIGNVAYGYYLIDSTVGTLCMLDTNTPNVTITDKNVAPSLTKYVDEADKSVQVGETATYRIVVSAGDGAEKYVLTDTMSEALDYVENSIKVYKVTNMSNDEAKAEVFIDEDTREISSGYNVGSVAGNHGFVITFDNNTTASWTSDDKIVVIYDATVNDNAATGTSITNSAKLGYGEGEDTPDTPDEESFTYQFDLQKTTMDADGQPTDSQLDGAKFKLYDSQDATESIKLVDISEAGSTTKVYRVAVENDTVITEEIEAGYAIVKGLDKDITYYLEETQAPTGYNLLTERKEVKLTRTVTTDLGANVAAEQRIANSTGTILPSTGGIGTTIFYAAGIILMAGAVFFVVRRKKA